MYVFGREEVRVGECVEAFRELFPGRESRVLVLYDTIYAHCIGKSLACMVINWVTVITRVFI